MSGKTQKIYQTFSLLRCELNLAKITLAQTTLVITASFLQNIFIAQLLIPNSIERMPNDFYIFDLLEVPLKVISFDARILFICFHSILTFMLLLFVCFPLYNAYVEINNRQSKKRSKKQFESYMCCFLFTNWGNFFFQPLLSFCVLTIACNELPNGVSMFVRSSYKEFCLESDFLQLFFSKMIYSLNIAIVFVFSLINIVFILPKNDFSENTQINESKWVDLCIIFKKLLLSVVAILNFSDFLKLKLIVFGIFLMLNLVELYQLQTTITFTTVNTLRFYTKLLIIESFVYALMLMGVHFDIFGNNGYLYFIIIGPFIYQIGTSLERVFYRNVFDDCLSDSEISDKHLLVFFILQQLAKQSAENELIISSKSDFADTEFINCYIMLHFVKCDLRDLCICSKIRKEKAFNSPFCNKLIKLKGQNDTNLAEFVCNIDFITALIFHRLKMNTNVQKCSKNIQLFFFKFLVLDYSNFQLKSIALNSLNIKSKGFVYDYELFVLKFIFEEVFCENTNHQNKTKEYLNLENFHKLCKHGTEIETQMVSLLGVYFQLMQRLWLPNLNETVQDQILQNIMNKFEVKISSFRKLVFLFPKNLQMTKTLGIFVFHFFKNDVASMTLKRWITFTKTKLLSNKSYLKICSSLKFFFDQKFNSLLLVEMDGTSQGSICWMSANSHSFFGFTFKEFQGRHISTLMTKKVAKNHQGFYQEFLKTQESFKVFSIKQLVVKMRDEYLELVTSSVKPFFEFSKSKILYFAYFEKNHDFSPMFFYCDSVGFVEGISQSLKHKIFKNYSDENKLASLSIFAFFPILLEYFLVVSEKFRDIFYNFESNQEFQYFTKQNSLGSCSDFSMNATFYNQNIEHLRHFRKAMIEASNNKRKIDFVIFKAKLESNLRKSNIDSQIILNVKFEKTLQKDGYFFINFVKIKNDPQSDVKTSVNLVKNFSKNNRRKSLLTKCDLKPNCLLLTPTTNNDISKPMINFTQIKSMTKVNFSLENNLIDEPNSPESKFDGSRRSSKTATNLNETISHFKQNLMSNNGEIMIIYEKDDEKTAENETENSYDHNEKNKRLLVKYEDIEILPQKRKVSQINTIILLLFLVFVIIFFALVYFAFKFNISKKLRSYNEIQAGCYFYLSLVESSYHFLMMSWIYHLKLRQDVADMIIYGINQVVGKVLDSLQIFNSDYDNIMMSIIPSILAHRDKLNDISNHVTLVRDHIEFNESEHIYTQIGVIDVLGITNKIIIKEMESPSSEIIPTFLSILLVLLLFVLVAILSYKMW